MRKIALIVFTILVLLAAACGKPKEAEAEAKPLILCSIHPYELLLQQLVGDGIEVKSLIPPNASPHTFSPTPADLKDLHRAELVISNGLGLEHLIEQALGNLEAKQLVAADLLKDLIALDSLKQVRHHQLSSDIEEDDHGHQHALIDPHLWTSPQLLQKLTTKLKNELVLLFPDFAPLITHNHDIIQKELSELDSRIRHERTAFEAPAIITYHNSFHYFTRDYNIHYAGWVQSSPGKEPSARELAALGTTIRQHRIKAIFIEPQQNPKSAEILAKEYKLKLETLDPLGGTLPVKSVAELMAANWQIMKESFSPKPDTP